MKRLIIFFGLILGGKLFSQDQLFKKDNTKHEVKILEVTPDEVKYKLKANPDGPLYIVKKSEVALIIYENGSHETYPDAKPLTQTVTILSPYNIIDSIRVNRKRETLKKFYSLTKNKNVGFVNILGIGNSCLSLSYLREFGKGYFSVHVPVSFSVAKPLGGQYLNIEGGGIYYENISNYKLNHKAIEGGVGTYFHTSGKRAVTHFVGPLVSFAQYNGTFEARSFVVDTTFGYTNVRYVDPAIKHGFVLNQISVMLNNGFLIRISPELNLMIHAAVGFTGSQEYIGNHPQDYAYYRYGRYNRSNIQVVNLGFSFGYRF